MLVNDNIPAIPLIAFTHAAYLLESGQFAPREPELAAFAANEDNALIEALAVQHIHTHRVAWSDPAVQWGDFDLVVLRGVWDYFEHFDAFDAWLHRNDIASRLVNPAPLVHWNIDKRYLIALARAGIPVVPTSYLPAGSQVDFDTLSRETGWEEMVIKPAVSAGGVHTYRVRRSDVAIIDVINAVSATTALLVQPFMPTILQQGEVSLIMIDGEFTHGIRKRAGADEFRVQSIHGGTIESYTPSTAERQFANAVLAQCPQKPVYARVDLVQAPDGPMLMELELIEPDLFLRLHAPAARALAEALARRCLAKDAA